MKLIANVHVAGHGWWGPAHGRVNPPPEVAVLIQNPACWDALPVDGSGDREPPPVGAAAGSGDDGQEHGPSRDPNPSLDDLDKAGLIAVAEAEGVEVDGRWGERRIRDMITAARAGS